MLLSGILSLNVKKYIELQFFRWWKWKERVHLACLALSLDSIELAEVTFVIN